MLKLGFTFLWFCASLVYAGCGDDVGNAGNAETPDGFDSPTIRISSRAVVTKDAVWKAQLSMLNELSVLEDDIELTFQAPSLVHGHYKSLGDFQKALDRVTRSPEGNVSIRLVATICLAIAEDLKAPALAGDLFLSLLNQSPMDVESMMGGKAPDNSEILRRIKQSSVMVVTPLAHLETFEPPQILNNIFLAVNTLSAHLSGDYEVHQLFLSNLHNGITSLGFQPLRSQPQLIGEDQWQVIFRGPERNHFLVWESPSEDPGQAPVFFLPALAKAAPELKVPTVLQARWNSHPLAGVVRVGFETAYLIQCRLMARERMLLPALIRSGAYEMAFDVQTAVGGNPGLNISPLLWKRAYLFDERKFPTESREIFQAALAQLIHSSVQLSPVDRAAGSVHGLAIRLFFLRADRNLNYADFELAARAYDLRFVMLACPEERDGFVRGWPWKPSGTPPPQYTAWAHVGSPADVARFKKQWGMSDEENIRRLREDTGIFVQP